MRKLWFAATVLLVFLLTVPTTEAVDYPSLVETKSRSVLPLKFNVKMTVTRQGNSNTRTINGAANGILVSQDGLILISARQLEGPAMFQQSNRPGISIETITEKFRTRMPDGQWLTTELLARDAGLDLAFLKIKDSLENYETVEPVSFPEDPPDLAVGQRVIHISRFRQGLNYEPHLLTTRISGIIREPRLRFSLMDGPGMLANFIGSPAFDSEGDFVGMATFRGSGSGGRGQRPGANPFANMSRNQQFLLPGTKIEEAIENFRTGVR